MEKILIISVNSKYIHSSLAPWYIKYYSKELSNLIDVVEYTINENIDYIVSDIYNRNSTLIAFGCYIWNIDIIKKIGTNIKKLNSEIKIVCGGPEVSYEIKDILNENLWIDVIVKGEGEIVFSNLVKSYIKEKNINSKIKGVYTKKSKEFECASMLIENLDNLPSPYTDEMLSQVGNRIIYYESSRGCPYNCSYCLSSVDKRVRYFSLDRVKMDISKILEYDIKQIKFVDRTFNSNKVRFMFLVNMVKDINKKVNFHFEISAHIIDDEMLDLLKTVPSGRIQLEIGVQSTNTKTLKAVDRIVFIDDYLTKIRKIKELKNVHIHLDLIVGLPYENIEIFKESFNQVYSIYPEKFQLGFLKFLKGTKIRNEAKMYNADYRNYAPYEILQNDFMTYNEIMKLKKIEHLLDKYYNSKKFTNILKFILVNNFFKDSYDFYNKLSNYYKKTENENKNLSMINMYNILNLFLKENLNSEYHKLVNDILKFDFLVSDNSKNVPKSLEREISKGFKAKCSKFCTQNYDYLLNKLKIDYKDIKSKIHFEIFRYNFLINDEFKYEISEIIENQSIILFDYSKELNIFGKYNSVSFQLIDIEGGVYE